MRRPTARRPAARAAAGPSVHLGPHDVTAAVAARARALAAELRSRRVHSLGFAGSDPLALLAAARAAFEAEVAFVPAPGADEDGGGGAVGNADALVRHVTHLCTDAGDLIARSRPAGEPEPSLDGVAFVCSTSGTSGRRRHVPWTRTSVAYQAAATAGRMAYGTGERVAVLVPLSSAYGLSVVVMWLHGRIGLVVPTTLRPDSFCVDAAEAGVTAVEAPPAWWGLVDQLGRWRNLPHRVRTFGCGGDRLPLPLARACLDATGRPLLDGYGLTEAGPNVALSGPGAWKLGTVGRALDGTDLAIDDDGALLVRGPGISPGYLTAPGAAPAPVHPPADGPCWVGGWLCTGDFARRDADGFITITGRATTRLKIRGEFVQPELVEQCLRDVREVVDAAVVARPVAGKDVLAAYVVARRHRDLEERCRRQARGLPLSSRPRFYHFVEELPRNAAGKIDRNALPPLPGEDTTGPDATGGTPGTPGTRATPRARATGETGGAGRNGRTHRRDTA